MTYSWSLLIFKIVQKLLIAAVADADVTGPAQSSSMFAVGLLLSSNPAIAAELAQVPSSLFQGSLLLGLISRATIGYRAMHGAMVSTHPLVIADWHVLTTSAFNMLPVGCLDGGRAVQIKYDDYLLHLLLLEGSLWEGFTNWFWVGNILTSGLGSAWWTSFTSVGSICAYMSEDTGEAMLERCNRDRNLEESSSWCSYIPCIIDTPSSMG